MSGTYVEREKGTGNEHPEMLINFSRKTSPGTSNGNLMMRPMKTVESNKTSSFKAQHSFTKIVSGWQFLNFPQLLGISQMCVPLPVTTFIRAL